jgi:hypothetical protein
MYMFLINPQSQINEEFFFTELKMSFPLAISVSQVNMFNANVLLGLTVGDVVEFPRGLFSHYGIYIGQYPLILCSLIHLDYIHILYIGGHRYPLSLFSYIRFAKYTLKQVEIKLVNVIYTDCSKSKYSTTY